jgi:hypothetical protein
MKYVSFIVAIVLSCIGGIAHATCSNLAVPVAQMNSVPLLYVYGTTLGPGSTPGASPVAGNTDCTLGSGGGGSTSGFAPNGNYGAPLSVTTTSSSQALPNGTVVTVFNTGTNTAYINLGTSAGVTATASNTPVPAGGWFSFTVGTNTYLAALT